MFRSKQGVTESAADLIALPDDQMQSKVDFAAAIQVAPGDSAGTLLDLKPGGYIGFCFLPMGGQEANPPHFTKGMLTEFTVK